MDDDGRVLRTSRMRLRPVHAADAALVDELNRDPLVRRYLGTLEPSADIFARWLREPNRWVAHDLRTGEFVGSFGLRPSAPDEYEIGYRLRSQLWGRGLATEGARALVVRGFDTYGAQRVWGRTMAVNVASRRVMEKAGLRYVRTFVHAYDEVLPGSEHGDVEYQLRREDW